MPQCFHITYACTYVYMQVLPGMLKESAARKANGLSTQDSGIIVNIASIQGLQSQDVRTRGSCDHNCAL